MSLLDLRSQLCVSYSIIWKENTRMSDIVNTPHDRLSHIKNSGTWMKENSSLSSPEKRAHVYFITSSFVNFSLPLSINELKRSLILQSTSTLKIHKGNLRSLDISNILSNRYGRVKKANKNYNWEATDESLAAELDYTYKSVRAFYLFSFELFFKKLLVNEMS